MTQLSKYSVVKKIIEDFPSKGLIGLGAGSTINLLIKEINKSTKDLQFITASSSTSLSLLKNKLSELSTFSVNNIPLCIDGADLVIDQEKGRVILKGLGGAPTGEKLLWNKSDKVIIAIDSTKLEIKDPIIIPVEIIPQSYQTICEIVRERFQFVEDIKLRTTSRMDMPFITDFGNYIIDLFLDHLYPDLTIFHKKLKLITGVVETGIFCGSFIRKTKIYVGNGDHVSIMNY